MTVLENFSRRASSSEKTLQEIIRRVAEVAKLEKIILWLCPRRDGPHSDVDLLVVKKGKFDRSRLVETSRRHLYMKFHGVGQAVDVIVVTPQEVERYHNTHCLVIAPALREGREVYRA